MAIIFYLLGWIGILAGAGWAGYNVFQNIRNMSAQVDIMNYLVQRAPFDAAPGAQLLFVGLLLLAVGGILARLSEIAYNTRNG